VGSDFSKLVETFHQNKLDPIATAIVSWKREDEQYSTTHKDGSYKTPRKVVCFTLGEGLNCIYKRVDTVEAGISTVYDSRWGTKEFILSVTKSSGMSALPLTALE
jgi:hypothetical protein